MYAEPSPLPAGSPAGSGRCTGRRTASSGSTALRLDRRAADPRPGGDRPSSSTSTSSTAWCGASPGPRRLFGRDVLAPVPERPDPVLRGGHRAWAWRSCSDDLPAHLTRTRRSARFDPPVATGVEESAMATLLVITVLLPLARASSSSWRRGWTHRSARSIALGTALATLAFSLILLVRVPDRAWSTPQFAFGDGGGAVRLELAGAARHPVRAGARRDQPLAVRADGAADDPGDLRLVGVGARSGRRRITPCCWPSRPGCSGSSRASTSCSSTSSSSSR